MDFGTLINVAQKNETKKQAVKCYQTKFAPPKKQTKQSKTLSDNIKKFLARKEEEERRKALEEKRKREDRVKQALKQQELEENSGHRRKRKSSASNVKEAEIDEKVEKNVADKIKEEGKDEKPKPKRKSLPPPMGFAELLKLAEKKQHEPVMVEVKPKVEEERPMTKRQKIEHIQERERKEQRGKKNLETNKKTSITNVNKPNKTQLNRISKTSEKSPILNSILNKSCSSKAAATSSKKIIDKSNEKHNAEKCNSSKTSSKNELLEERKKLDAERKQLEEMRRAIEEEKRKLAQSKNKQEDVKFHSSNKEMAKSKGSGVDKQISKDIKPRQFSSSDLKLHSSLANNRLKQISPSNVRSIKSKEIIKKPLTSNKRRICDEDEDSDLDDFIDDGSDNNEEDYSKHISEIFNYDRSKYFDNEDDTAMESNFAQQLKEEYISAKIGIMEDLEDMRMEALEKKKKDLLKRSKK
ncbi:protein spt2-like protein [Lasius niger]|uniref:Protein SPT2 homolog n=1 Tax=Lasius niger TaxID=67767 RepID=A0A0J7KFG8_LASNI|nr:protein spt2-like protein [Lasius niger]